MSLAGISAAGIHTYFGGFHRSLEEDTDWQGSAENWAPAVRARALAGLRTLPHPGSAPRVSLVVSNPPCSRFSAMSTGNYHEGHKSQLRHFCELEDAVAYSARCGAEAFWWETGPLAWTQGRDLVRAVHRHLSERWGGCTTVAVKFDTRWAGVPQRRPRCHFVHVAGARRVPERVPPAAWPIAESALSWARRRIAEQGFGSDSTQWGQIRPRGGYRKMTALAYYEFQMMVGAFIATRPQLVGLRDHFVNAVLSGRPLVIDEEDSFVSWEEYAALHCMPLGQVLPVFEGQGGWQALTMMSKGVSPSASRWVADWVTAPLLGLSPQWEGVGPEVAEESSDPLRIGWVEAVAPDWPKRRSAYGEGHRRAVPLRDQAGPRRSWE